MTETAAPHEPAAPPLERLPGRWRRWLGAGKAHRPGYLVGDANQLPLRSRSADLLWANLLLPWLEWYAVGDTMNVL